MTLEVCGKTPPSARPGVRRPDEAAEVLKLIANDPEAVARALETELANN
jgi:hypothetical protein